MRAELAGLGLLLAGVAPLGCAAAVASPTRPNAVSASPGRGSPETTDPVPVGAWRNPTTQRVEPKDPTFRCPGMPGPPLPPPPQLSGKVIGVSRQFQLVIVDLAGDSGILPGHFLELSRDGRKIGRIRVDRVFPDRTVCTLEGDASLDERHWPPLLGAVAVTVAY